jgi:peptide/nickel transport system substrate-binding protein
MMQNTRRGGGLRAKAAVIGAAFALSACAGGGATLEKASDTNATLLYDLGLELTTLDPAASFDVSGSTIIAQLYDQLLDYNAASGELEGELAESYEFNEDATEYTFKLREDVTFASGNPVTSDDVVFALERLKNLQQGSAYLMEGLTVSAPDKSTVVITSEIPKPELPAMVATTNFAIYDSVEVKKRGGLSDASAVKKDTASKAFDSASFGSGPYKLVRYQPNAEVVLGHNDKYRGDKPDFTNVIVRNSRSIQQQITNIQNGGSDLTNSLSSPQVADLDQSKVNVKSQPLPQEIYLALTNSGGPTVDANFRKAVALGIDYDAIKALAGQGAVQGTGVIPTSIEGSIPEGQGLKRDVEGAKAALAASGKANQELAISFGTDYAVGGQDMSLFAQKIQFSLQEIGMKVRLNGAPTQVSRTANQEGKVQAALWPFPPDYADASQFLIHSPDGLLAKRIHWTAKEAPELAALAKKAQVAITPEDRAKAYEEWARALRDTNRFVSIVEVPQNLVTSKRVGGLNMNVLGVPDLAHLTLEQ